MQGTPVLHALRRWWLTVAIVGLLLVIAIVATPAGQTLAGAPLQAVTSTYFSYLSLIFKQS